MFSHIMIGTNDLVKDMRARHTPMRLPMVAALGIGMLAARAYGLTILDGVYNDIQDSEGFRAVCRQGLEMGFDGKTLIHPSQVEPCNEVFAPSSAELESAAKIVLAQGPATAAALLLDALGADEQTHRAFIFSIDRGRHLRFSRRQRSGRRRGERQQQAKGDRVGECAGHVCLR